MKYSKLSPCLYAINRASLKKWVFVHLKIVFLSSDRFLI